MIVVVVGFGCLVAALAAHDWQSNRLHIYPAEIILSACAILVAQAGAATQNLSSTSAVLLLAAILLLGVVFTLLRRSHVQDRSADYLRLFYWFFPFPFLIFALLIAWSVLPPGTALLLAGLFTCAAILLIAIARRTLPIWVMTITVLCAAYGRFAHISQLDMLGTFGSIISIIWLAIYYRSRPTTQ